MELKPCPFCGSDNIEIYPTGYGRPPKWAVMCDNCQAEGPVDLGESGAVEQWNTRPSEKEYEIEFDNYVRECGRLQIEKDAAEAQVIELLRYKTGFDEAMRRLEAAEARAAEPEARAKRLRMILDAHCPDWMDIEEIQEDGL
jgi:Lar family restriction alleviation protein